MGHQVITLTPKGERWQKSGHPWVYRDDIDRAPDSGSGEALPVKAPNGRLLGRAFYNSRSKIALRWLTSDPETPVDDRFWEERVRAAVEYRQRVVDRATAYRVISSEADGFPGLIVDKYGPVLVVQCMSLGMERALQPVLAHLERMLKPESVVARNDSHIRELEGMPVEKRLISGKQPERVQVAEGEVRYWVDVWAGQKTGAFLDQRENRLRARTYARGKALDAFAYHGGFSLQIAAGASSVLALEDSDAAVEQIRENLALNGISNVQAERANAFDRLRELDRLEEKFDLIVLDPPAFAKNKQEIENAWRGYREINLRAMRLLRPGGTLISCSCSYNIGDEMFLAILREAARDSQRRMRLLEIRTQSKDHPILLTHPESKYLKCVVLEAS